MTPITTPVAQILAGIVRARCSCCTAPQPLITHPDLDATRMLCPVTQRTYLDRGDGVYEQDGGRLGSETVVPGAAVSACREDGSTSAEVLSDRPRKTGPKTRIELERATFA